MTQKKQKLPVRLMFLALIVLGTAFLYAQQAPSLTISNTKEETWGFSIRVMTQTFATETVFFSQTEGVTTFLATSVLLSQGQQAVFKAKGKTDGTRITDYALEADYNGKHTEIIARVKGEVLEVQSGDKRVTVPWTRNTILLDNNLSFMWQYFLYDFPYAGTDDFIAVIPQLILSQEQIAYPLAIQRMVECDGKVTLNFKLVNSMGVINADNRYHLFDIQIGATKVERNY
ncbi:MAG TPA: hypothetical protein PKM99_03550 [Thermotogota bacterium]|nr:hypothetical protein [Thermotogota bacterium]HNT95168.1 hypothetical protein [Thermotogota bacterium]HQC38943.1 hypothetical protein [Thermotogota bacterium]HQQ66094.1 hypothetical protein [Thermotogota bacterium]